MTTTYPTHAPDWITNAPLMFGRYALADVRAGWIDERRTPGADWRTGWTVGDHDYAVGWTAAYLLERLTRRTR